MVAFAPSLANRIALAPPVPRAAPVTLATLPFGLIWSLPRAQFLAQGERRSKDWRDGASYSCEQFSFFQCRAD